MNIRSDEFQKWLLYTPLGKYILSNEISFYDSVVNNAFGYYAIQLALPKINFLKANRISSKYFIDSNIKCDLHFLPFETNSIDLIICPHVFDFTPNYHHILQECLRVLIPKGKLITTCFNSLSLFNLFRKTDPILKELGFINLTQLKKQLIDNGFYIEGGKFLSYRPPINNSKILNNLSWLDKAGNRWFPLFANNYAIISSKEINTPTIIPTKPAKEMVKVPEIKPVTNSMNNLGK